MAHTPLPKTIYIAYGLCEGRLVARNFINTAQKRGYVLVRKPNNATYIIGHSAGCYTLRLIKNRRVLLVGIPTLSKNTKSVLSQVLRKLRGELQDLGARKFLIKNISNIPYVLHIPRNAALRSQVLKRALPATNITFIRNRDDPFTGDILQGENRRKDRFISMPGGHDDLWINPDSYLDILESLYG